VFELLVGKPPWHDKKDIFSVFLQIATTQEPPKLPPNVSPELRSFIELCFKRDPHQRANVYELLRHSFINVQVKI
jgi:serine/threonine protein kinase